MDAEQTPPPERPAQPWHRTPMEPEGPPPWNSSGLGESVFGGETAPPAPPAEPPAVPPPAAPPPPSPAIAGGGVPPGPRTGGNLARGVFLYLGGASVLSGVFGLLESGKVGSAQAAAVLGVAFAVTFFAAMMLRAGSALDPVRATLGVISVVFLVGCYAVAVGGSDQSISDSSAGEVRAAVGAGLFTLGMAGVALLVPSAVAAGLAMVGLVLTVEVSSVAAGVTGSGLAVAGVVGGAVALELAYRVPRLRAHPGAARWMVNLAALLTGLAATALGVVSFSGTAIAAGGLTGVALVVVAWRWHAVVAAVVASLPLSILEGYIVFQAVGGDSTAGAVGILLVGLLVLIAVALLGMRLRGQPGEGRRRVLLVDEGLLLAAVVLSLIALGETGNGFNGLPGFPFGAAGPRVIEPSLVPFPRGSALPLPTFPSFPPAPTFPSFPAPPTFSTFPSG